MGDSGLEFRQVSIFARRDKKSSKVNFRVAVDLHQLPKGLPYGVPLEE